MMGICELNANNLIDALINDRQPAAMSISLAYPHDAATAAPAPLRAEALWALGVQVRRQVLPPGSGLTLSAQRLAAVASTVTVNGRRLTVAWEFGSAVHDAGGAPVLGVCEIDAALPDTAVVSVNGQAVAGRPDLAVSTAAHELGHVLFDVPPALASADPQRRYRATLSRAEDLLDRTTARAERRANEFMGALLAPAGPLHMRLLVHARAEGLRMVHAAHHGRPGSRILAASNPPDAVAGVLAVLAGDFAVSERFIAVRLQRYRLIEGGRLP